MGRTPPSSSSSVSRRRRRITVLKKGMSKKSSSWSEGWAKDRNGGGRRIRAQTRTAKVPKSPKGKELTWVEKTKTLHETGTLRSETRATWHKSSNEGHKREEDLLAMSEDIKEYIGEAVKARAELKDGFKECLAANTEADVILEAKRLQKGIFDVVSGMTPRPGIKQERKVRASMIGYGTGPRATTPRGNTF